VRNVAARLKQTLSRDCLMGQLREDTIAMAFVLPAGKSPDADIGKLLDCFRSPFLLGDHMLAQTASIGTARHPDDGDNSDSLLKRARTALNAMPPSDASRYRQYSRKLSAEAARRFEIETALKGALERDELELFYQPKVLIESRKLVGAEALLRWTTPKLGKVAPGEFIPIAEESGLIVELGDWALASACRQLAAWRAEGRDCPEISVNVSSIQLRGARFCELVREVLALHSLEGARLNVEITEGTLIENMGDAVRIMSELRAMDVTISIDDFGKGFSSLSYLARMPVQILKIDRSFIDRIPDQPSAVTLVRSIIAMGRALGLTLVAEGVETEAQLESLRSAGCSQIQGFLVSRPLDAGTFARQCLASGNESTPSGAP
jgi:EAL domain-containing protein (putative c-di-GMP-specific phosphodiesterase class I)